MGWTIFVLKRIIAYSVCGAVYGFGARCPPIISAGHGECACNGHCICNNKNARLAAVAASADESSASPGSMNATLHVRIVIRKKENFWSLLAGSGHINFCVASLRAYGTVCDGLAETCSQRAQAAILWVYLESWLEYSESDVCTPTLFAHVKRAALTGPVHALTCGCGMCPGA